MNYPPIRTNAPGIFADSVTSGNSTSDDFTGVCPAKSEYVGRVGLVGGTNRRLTETIPTA